VRVLSVVTISLALHTGDMAGDAGATAFVTGAAGFIGIELVKVLMARGHQVFGLTRSLEGAHRVRRAGAVPVMGDLLEPGQWQDEAAADWVFHLPPHPVRGARVTRRRAASITRARVLMDAHLLDAVAAGATRRIVYVADTSGYGATGSCPITEDEPPQPSAWGRCLTPALDRLDGYVVAGLPIVTAFPGWVYGNASWFRERVIEPIMAGHRVLQFGKTGPWVSPIHVHDCARALVHLAEYGVAGGRYFLVNSDPIRVHEFAATFARLANRPLRVWRVPAAATRLVVGPILADDIQADAVFSNIRLRGIGFRFLYPTLDQGLQQVLGALHE
jgi:nucleoside-diphosphate-sugar epimerase